MSKSWCRASRSIRRLVGDRSGLAAVEFAFIVPLLLVLFFGTVELCAGVAVDRKVTLVSRTLSDLVSQATSVTDSDLNNVFAASYGILSPYPATPTQATISEVYVNNSGAATVQWSRSATVAQSGSTVTTTLTTSSRSQGSSITIPAGLNTNGTYLILSEVSYLYQPAVGYVVSSAGVTLTDQSYTRPRQSVCVMYNTTVCTTY